MTEYKPVFGIDLGTTFSAIAYIDQHDKPVVIPNSEGQLTTPSIVYFSGPDSYVVGNEAGQHSIADPQNTCKFIKRQMGQSDYNRNIYGQDYKPQQISAMILQKLKSDAEDYFRQNIGEDIIVKDVVITVPAYFGMEQKAATKEAGEIAGLNVLHIINEPTAAALAYAINKLGKDQTVFVFDLGGGTFDVTVLSIKGNEVKMGASDGNPELGGKDWDDVLTDHCTEIFKTKHSADPQDDLHSYQEVYDRVLRAKISLSNKPKTQVLISYGGNMEKIELSQEDFQELSKNLLDQCRDMCSQVLKKANKNWNDIDIVLLVGGSTYMPMVRNMVKSISGKEPTTDVNPDRCVAIGAAWQAKYKYIEDEVEKVRQEKGESEAAKVQRDLLGALPGIEVTETVAKSMGIIVLDDNGEEIVQEMIPEQTEIPYTMEGMFGYAFDNMTSVKVEVTEGRGKTRNDVGVVGEIALDNLPARPRGTPIKVVYYYNKDKTLDIQVIDVETGKKELGKVMLQGQMSDEEKSAARRRHEVMTME